MTASTTTPRPTRSRVLSPGWWMRDRDGEVVLGQWPNPALLVWLVSLLVGWTNLLGAEDESVLTKVGQGALVAWALDELARGATPARRLIGAVVLVVELVRLFG